MLEKLGVYLQISAKEKENEILIKDMTRIQEGTYVMHCAIWYHFYNLKNVKNIHGEMLFLVKLQATLLKVTILHGYFSRFLNCTNGTESHKASHILLIRLKMLTL